MRFAVCHPAVKVRHTKTRVQCAHMEDWTRSGRVQLAVRRALHDAGCRIWKQCVSSLSKLPRGAQQTCQPSDDRWKGGNWKLGAAASRRMLATGHVLPGAISTGGAVTRDHAYALSHHQDLKITQYRKTTNHNLVYCPYSAKISNKFGLHLQRKAKGHNTLQLYPSTGNDSH